MKYKDTFIKTTKESKQFDSVNATLLQKGSFIDQTMAGVYTFLPLGWRVLAKIESIVREEVDKVGVELFMPAIAPKKLWEQTGRIESVNVLLATTPANEASRVRNDSSYILNSTHEEVITPIAKRLKTSYKDLPFAVYQIQTKFRNEERPKSGLLRGREFRMKDLYSFHASDEDRQDFYGRVQAVYMDIFKRLGLGEDTVIALASGGDFTKDFSHEFQTKCETGEDTVYYDEAGGVYYNKEIAPPEVVAAGNSFRASEVGNIFPLGTKFSSAIGYTYADEAGGQQPVYMASYGIGTSRIMGVLAEKFHDERGLIWPASVAPFAVHLVGLQPADKAVKEKADAVYETLRRAGVDVLYDDREQVGPGEKLADTDLLGIPWRAVVSQKTGNNIGVKRRTENSEILLSVEEFIKSQNQ